MEGERWRNRDRKKKRGREKKMLRCVDEEERL